MIVRLSQAQLKTFCKKALEAYPREIIAVLVGKQANQHSVSVSYFVYPERARATREYVRVSFAETYEIYQLHCEDGLKVVGSIHSHPNAWPIMSCRDKEDSVAWDDKVNGIVMVMPGYRSIVKFWRHDSAVPCEVEYFKRCRRKRAKVQ